MNIAQYRRHVENIPYGKRLPNALYVYRDGITWLGEELDKLLRQLSENFEINPAYNVIKFRLDELKVSFLAYPTFLEDPHPSLHRAITIDLVTRKSRQTDYETNSNPPILHRKEIFLPLAHPRRSEFEALTKAEEEAGVYEETSTIGFKLNWDRLLLSKGLRFEGHTLCRVDAPVPETDLPDTTARFDRHKTAMTRYDLSKPVKTLVEYGLLKPGSTFFDYGCGQGSDINGLRALGYDAEGWDPVRRPNVARRTADVVNLGYVLNVIEDSAERLESLVNAYRHASRLLIVAGLIQETVDSELAKTFGDGVITRRNTFQKFFEQEELQQYIEDALDVTAVPVGLGIFYVFRDSAEQQDFLSARKLCQ